MHSHCKEYPRALTENSTNVGSVAIQPVVRNASHRSVESARYELRRGYGQHSCDKRGKSQPDVASAKKLRAKVHQQRVEDVIVGRPVTRHHVQQAM
jgi:hypothetical protein